MFYVLILFFEMVGGLIEMEFFEVEVFFRVEFLKRFIQNGILNSFVVVFDIIEGFGGLMVFQFLMKSVINFFVVLMGMDLFGMKELDEMGKLVIIEVGNILILVYIDIFVKLVGELVLLSLLKLINFFYDIEKEFNGLDLRNVDKIMFFKMCFYEENIGFESFFYLVFDEEFFEKFVKRLEVQVKEEGGE